MTLSKFNLFLICLLILWSAWDAYSLGGVMDHVVEFIQLQREANVLLVDSLEMLMELVQPKTVF